MRVDQITTVITTLAAMLSVSLPARAATYTWTGGDGSSDSWYSAGNWGGTTVPSDDSASTYVFAASDWNDAQTTIAVAGSPDVQSLTFNANAGVPLTIQIGVNNSLYLDPSSSNSTTIAVAQTGVKHTIAGSSGASIQLIDNQQWSVEGDLEISAVIWDNGESPTPGFVKTGAGTLTLSGANSFSGPITINQGVISVSTIADKGQVCNLGTGELFGKDDLTLNGGILRYTGMGPNVSSRGFALGASGGTIDVQNAATSLTFTGAVTGSQGGLTKTGSGVLVLSSTSNYSSATTVQAGTLQFNGASSTMNVLTNGTSAGVNITGGGLILDYSNGGSDPASTVQSLLTTAYNGGASAFLSGQLRDTIAATSIGLGWADSPTISTVNGTHTYTNQVVVMPALYGDATLDGTVDGYDLGRLLGSYNASGKTWAEGDFTYDGTVDGYDLGKILGNYTKTGPVIVNVAGLNLDAAELGALRAAGITPMTDVPEPSSVIMLLAAASVGGFWAICRGCHGIF